MANIPRLLARLDIKGPNLIKGLQMEGLRVVGDPLMRAQQYYEQGVDGILIIDTVASLYSRDQLYDIVSSVAEHVYIPITVAGGVRSLDDADKLFASGADHIALNSGAIQDPKLIKEIANKYGSQSTIISIEAKKKEDEWQVLYNNGRELSGLNLFDWIDQVQQLGVGEILLTSVDHDGMRDGFDIDLVKRVEKHSKVQVIASGGFGALEHLHRLLDNVEGLSAVAIGSAFHYDKLTCLRVQQDLLRRVGMRVQ